ncbi:MAG: YigZ family protein, partial [Flavobacteriaceae bacterium]
FVAVVRIFGGTKLGVGGLITAYKSAAKMALESGTVVEKKLQAIFLINFPYVQMDKVMRIVKRKQLQIVSQKMELDCLLKVRVDYSEVDGVQEAFAGLREIKIQRL